MSFLKLPKNHWGVKIAPYLNHEHMTKLDKTIADEYQQHQILPVPDNIFRALSLTDFQDTKVVILGQDPYPNPKNATGLAFSVSPDESIPLSLQNIYLERQHDLGLPISKTGDLTSWAKQGVLLLNTTLTVQAGESNSHENLGWSEFTDSIIKALANSEQPLVFILWGKNAQSKKALIPDKDNIMTIESSHPSPFSARISFFNSYPFSRTNHFLNEHGATPIDWSVE